MRAYERLIRYAAFPTASKASSDTCPSTPAQTDFAVALAEEMRALGLTDVALDKNGYLFGTLEANIPDWKGKVIGFIAHQDVSFDVPCVMVKPRLIKAYDGGDILLNKEKNIILSPQEFPHMLNYKGLDLLVTDGTTLLGADDKAGIAEILTMAEYLLAHPDIKHGKIRIGFTPDEEIGRGAHFFDVTAFGADYAYTVDGEGFGEIEYENFNADNAKVTITGYNTHTGDAKNKMKNASNIAMEFDALLPEMERPENTEGYQGFYHITGIKGDVARAEISYFLRDFDMGRLTEKRERMLAAVRKINNRYGPDTVEVKIMEIYRNMLAKIQPHWHLIENAGRAIKSAGGNVVSKPIRGGTDGSQLSYMGLPCPNLGTGSHNHHSVTEFACLQKMDQCVEALVRIAEIYGAFAIDK